MADDVDKAGKLTEFNDAIALAEHYNRQRLTTPVVSSICCVDCGFEIPAERRCAMPVDRCIECQLLAERRGMV